MPCCDLTLCYTQAPQPAWADVFPAAPAPVGNPFPGHQCLARDTAAAVLGQLGPSVERTGPRDEAEADAAEEAPGMHGDDAGLHDLILGALGTDPRIPSAAGTSGASPGRTAAPADVDQDEQDVDGLLERVTHMVGAPGTACMYVLWLR